jgi:hypothetical protein
MVAPNLELLADRYRKSIKLFLRFSGISTWNLTIRIASGRLRIGGLLCRGIFLFTLRRGEKLIFIIFKQKAQTVLIIYPLYIYMWNSQRRRSSSLAGFCAANGVGPGKLNFFGNTP